MNVFELNDMEAVFGLRQLTNNVDTNIDLADEASVRTLVKTAAERALANSNDVTAFMALFEQPEAAASIARACLASVQEQPSLLEDQTGQLALILDNPPRTQQMDMGISLGLLALAGVAMFLSGSLKIKSKNFELEYQGSDKVVDIFKAVLPKIPGWIEK